MEFLQSLYSLEINGCNEVTIKDYGIFFVSFENLRRLS